MKKNLHGIRNSYLKGRLNENEAPDNPFQFFGEWIDQAFQNKVNEPSAMVLSTASGVGRSSSRVVLLKHFDINGFTFFTNYESRKGIELNENPFASLLFFWPELECQVRIEGRVEKTDQETSDRYFNSRPLGSRISAAVSPQSKEVASRAELEEIYRKKEEEIKNSGLSRPSFWGGYRLVPDYFEFWKGRENRLHDRLSYKLENEGWKLSRLAP